MKKLLYFLETFIFVLCLGGFLIDKFVPSFTAFHPYVNYFILVAFFDVLLFIITLGIASFAKEIGCDVKHKKKSVRNEARQKVIFDDVTKQELGIPLHPEKVVEEEAAPTKVIEEQPIETPTEEPVKEEAPVEEAPVEEVKEESVPEEAPVEEVKEEPVAEETPVEEPVVEEEQPVEEPVVEPEPEEVKEPIVEEPVQEEVPVEEAPVEEVKEEPVVEETPVEEPVVEEEQPVEEPVEEPEVNEVPAGPALKLQPTVLAPFRIFDDFTYSIGKRWTELFQGEMDKTYFKDMVKFLQEAYENKNVYPPKEDLMKCFEYCDFENTRVVIIGKFPFYRKNQADGLAYSTRAGKSPNQTTSIIIKEAISDVGIPVVNSGSLVNWAKNGVLLLNSIMTAPSDKPASHMDCGWVTFTNKIIELLNMDSTPKAFVLWGEYAEGLKPLITNPNHLILEAPNPSPLSAANGFYGSKPFSKINEFLVKNNIEPIDWSL